MKKYVWLLLAVCILGGCSARETMSTGIVSDNEEVWYNKSKVLEPTPVPENRKVLISAAGDTTLATDVNFGGSTSFVSEVKRQNYDYSYFFRNVADIFENDDLTIVNFEGTLSENGVRKDKTYAFRGNPEYVKILTEGNVDAVNLANNHSYDYGSVSYSDTVEHIENTGITTFGYDRTAIYTVNDVKIGLFGISALSGTSIPSAKSQIDERISELRKDGAEIIIFNVHWGIEGDHIPADKQRQIGKYAIDSGADLVLGHHPHVIQSIEKYKDKYIVYSLGNFCFGGNKNPSDKDCFIWQQEFEIDYEGNVYINEPLVIPCSVSSVRERNNFQPTPLEGERAEKLIKRLEEYSKAVN